MRTKVRGTMKRLVFVGGNIDCGCAPITVRFGRLLARLRIALFFSEDREKRSANIEVLVRCGVFNSLRRSLPDSTLLQQAGLAATDRPDPPTAAPVERLPSVRSAFGFFLHPHCWVAAGQQNRDSAVQRSVPFAGRAGKVS